MTDAAESKTCRKQILLHTTTTAKARQPTKSDMTHIFTEAKSATTIQRGKQGRVSQAARGCRAVPKHTHSTRREATNNEHTTSTAVYRTRSFGPRLVPPALLVPPLEELLACFFLRRWPGYWGTLLCRVATRPSPVATAPLPEPTAPRRLAPLAVSNMRIVACTEAPVPCCCCTGVDKNGCA